MAKLTQSWNRFISWLRNKGNRNTFANLLMGNRNTFANLLMVSFIMFTSIGAGLIFPPAGLVVAGIACGIYGFLLGSE